ncbi:hypothetical protein QVD17_17057 [Tagetes erecta]|uniref:Small auxin up regulated protein n=1 Tax=Tagetes erecta TaxID=13708 RepID=A0AAD8KV81_TARER|nr:hypothetical protein QVD17_17057 [Tagetes erecta]
MKKIRGFRIRHKLVKVIKWGVNRRSKGSSSYITLNRSKIKAKLCGFARSLKKGAKNISFGKKSLSYIRVTEEEVKNSVPKGHLAVYVGDDAHRVLVPVIYFNHPLFGDLLREAEKVYGFKYEGGIHVPCRIAEFENVQTRIDADGGCEGFRGERRRWRLNL